MWIVLGCPSNILTYPSTYCNYTSKRKSERFKEEAKRKKEAKREREAKRKNKEMSAWTRREAKRKRETTFKCS